MLPVLLLVFLSSIWKLPLCMAGCDPKTGPSGSTECVLLKPYYSKKQWSTCLTDAYIRLKSGGRHRCRNKTVKYCWYQCMVESNNISRGPVYKDCLCRSGQATPLPDPSATTLPQWCYSPTGENCLWYKQCLENKHNCENTTAAYAITYAEKYCSLYADSASKFSDVGKRWINAVRKCLQVSLVPVLRPWFTVTCNKIRETAFESYPGCYLRSYMGSLSICDLPFSEWWQVFWTVKGSFLEAFVPSLKGMIEITYGCTKNPFEEKFKGISYAKLGYDKLNSRKPRFMDDDKDFYAGEIINSIADYLGWRSQGVGWFAFMGNETIKNNNKLSHIVVILGDRLFYDTRITSSQVVDLKSVVKRMADAIQQGKLSFKLQTKRDEVYIRYLEACEDMICKNKYLITFAPPSPSSSSHLCLSTYIVLPCFLVKVHLWYEIFLGKF